MLYTPLLNCNLKLRRYANYKITFSSIKTAEYFLKNILETI